MDYFVNKYVQGDIKEFYGIAELKSEHGSSREEKINRAYLFWDNFNDDQKYKIETLSDIWMGLVSAPDLKEPEPDLKEFEPDLKEPEPDLKEPDCDLKEPDCDLKEPEPDLKEPDCDLKEPEPDSKRKLTLPTCNGVLGVIDSYNKDNLLYILKTKYYVIKNQYRVNRFFMSCGDLELIKRNIFEDESTVSAIGLFGGGSRSYGLHYFKSVMGELEELIHITYNILLHKGLLGGVKQSEYKQVSFYVVLMERTHRITKGYMKKIINLKKIDWMEYLKKFVI